MPTVAIKPRSRWSAAFIHVALSILVVGTIALAVIFTWFPGGLWHVAGLQKLFGIMIAVDVVVGPVLTWLVFKPGKPGLRFDLTAIALAQAAFLAYGIHTLWSNRPLFLVGSTEAFALVFASELPEDAPQRAEQQGWPRFRRHGPWLVGVDLSSPYAKDEYLFAFMMGSGGPLRDIKLFVPYAKVRADILARAKQPSRNIDTGGRPRSQFRARALLSIRSAPTAILLDPNTGEPLEAATGQIFQLRGPKRPTLKDEPSRPNLHSATARNTPAR